MSGEKSPPPIIRQDLSLLEAEPDAQGRRAWLLHDPLSARYYRIGQAQMELLSYLDGGDAETIAAHATKGLGYDVSAIQVEELFEFLRKNTLVIGDNEQQGLYAKMRAKSPGWLATMAKSYLFIRVPLFKPDKFLERTLPKVMWLASKPARMAIGIMGLLGIFMTARQFDSFLATFLYFFSIGGAVAFAISLMVVKALHELGHAYVAKSYGCRVPVIGVAFLVLWPVLYTDNTDTWRLSSRKARLRVGLAGVAVEMAVAALSLFAWSIMPDGVLRSVFFILATSTWIASLLINFNPLMRFDGYYLLSDWLKEPNLESRSHAIAKWWLRKKLFDFSDQPPEHPKPRLIVYSISIWIYRFFLFLGIALLVYHLFFKLLGVVLFFVELIYFIIAPIWREVREWVKRREQLTLNPASMRTMGGVVFLLLLVFVPWQGTIEAPAILKSHYITVYAPAPGKISHFDVKMGQQVTADELLAVVHAPDLEFEIEQAQLRYLKLLWQRSSLGFSATSLDRALVIASELKTQNQRLRGLGAKQERLRLVAPKTGTVTDLDPELQAGQWVEDGAPLFAFRADEPAEITAYLTENILQRTSVGQTGKFYPEGGGREVSLVSVIEIEKVGITSLDDTYSASLFGGGVAVRQNDDDELIPAQAVYRMRLSVTSQTPPAERVLRGVVVLDVSPQSIAGRFIRRAFAILLRESSF